MEGRLKQRARLLAVQRAAEQARLTVFVEDILARLRAEIDNAPLIDDHHALPVGHGDDRALGDHIVILDAAAAEAALRFLQRPGGQHVVRQGVRVEVLLPLAGKRSAHGAKAR